VSLIVNIAIYAVAAIFVVGAVGFVVIDMVTRVDYIHEKFPWLQRIVARRDIFGVLLLVAIGLLVAVGYEWADKEVPEVSLPTITFNAPPPPLIPDAKIPDAKPASLPEGQRPVQTAPSAHPTQLEPVS
jgi:hypothetical protein